ncbi:Hypothetical predicted protein [Lecanosticta acicola]|uniref:Heterokaryon incompatibility domain-containing protein n=1 Tax=Lecanosticta acicola TaxID=111012 RepID=A0AAI8Z3K6_9PEZI|nr:Hypothetical predicted protein [Lecanosticta acicola]
MRASFVQNHSFSRLSPRWEHLPQPGYHEDVTDPTLYGNEDETAFGTTDLTNALSKIESSLESLYSTCKSPGPLFVRLHKFELSNNIDEPFRASMRVICLAVFDQSSSLSHAWGTGINTEYTTCDDVQLPISLSLLGALRRILENTSEEAQSRPSLPPFKRVIRVDAVCLNQKEDEDRAQQVQTIGLVFGLSRSLIIWLGEAANKQSVFSSQALRGVIYGSEAANVLRDLLRSPWFQHRRVIPELLNPVPGSRFMLHGNFCFYLDQLFVWIDRLNQSGSIIKSVDLRTASVLDPILKNTVFSD